MVSNLEPTHMAIKDCSFSQILIFGGYLKVRESLYIRVIVWIDTVLNHFDAWAMFLRCQGSCNGI
jgi:hypothetical protein